MVDEREIWACANLLTRQHGGNAEHIASQRAAALGADGNDKGKAVFLAIAERIRQLETLSPAGKTH